MNANEPQRLSLFVAAAASLVLVALLAAGCGSRATQGRLGEASPPPRVPAERPSAPDASLRRDARAAVYTAASSQNPVERAQALEGALHLDAGEAMALVKDRLDDPEPVVRFAAAVTAGRGRLTPLADDIERLVEDPDPGVRVAAVFALHRFGDTRFSRRLQDTASHPDPFVRANTALVLGLTGEPTAVRVLQPMRADDDPNVRLNVAEALWRLGDEAGFQGLLAASISAFADDKVIGTLGLSARGDSRAEPALRGKLTDDYAEVTLAAARGLGQLGSDAGYGVALRYVNDRDPRRRAMAALALGDIGRLDAQRRLRPLLADRDDAVRLSAAVAALQLTQPYLTASARD